MGRKINMVSVKSNMVREVGFDAKTKAMTVGFQDGGIYAYAPATQDLFNAVIAAPSVGQFMRQNVINAPGLITVKVGEYDKSGKVIEPATTE